MSCSWHIRCVTCAETLCFEETNRRAEVPRAFIRHIGLVAALLPLFEEKDVMFELSGWGVYGAVRADEVRWLAQHRDHELRPIDEYGRIDMQCRGWADCNAGHSHACQLDAGHEGPHSAVPRAAKGAGA